MTLWYKIVSDESGTQGPLSPGGAFYEFIGPRDCGQFLLSRFWHSSQFGTHALWSGCSSICSLELKQNAIRRLFSFFPHPKKKLICEIECGKRARDELLCFAFFVIKLYVRCVFREITPRAANAGDTFFVLRKLAWKKPVAPLPRRETHKFRLAKNACFIFHNIPKDGWVRETAAGIFANCQQSHAKCQWHMHELEFLWKLKKPARSAALFAGEMDDDFVGVHI